MLNDKKMMNDGVIGDEFDGVIGVTSSVMPSIVCHVCTHVLNVHTRIFM